MSFIKDIARIQKAIEESFNEAISVPAFRPHMQKAANLIRIRTRLGSGVKSVGGTKQALKPLADSTKENRKRLKIQGKLSSLTSPGKSNLTMTGQMLESLKGDAVSRGKGIIRLTGTRPEGLSNEKLGEYVSEARPFMNLTKSELKEIVDDIRKDALQRVRRALTRR
jgi:hypothetical protein